MPKQLRLRLLKLDSHIGVFDTKTKKRLEDLLPKKRITVKRPASAYEKGYTFMESTDLHERLARRRTVSMKEYKKLKVRF